MKRTDWTAALILVALLLVGCACTGCSRFKTPAAIPSDQKGAIVLTPETMKVLLAGVNNDAQVLASALESSPESGSVLYQDHYSYAHAPDGSIQTDPKTGEALKTRTKMVAKLNSMQSFTQLQGVAEVDYEIGGRSWFENVPDNLKAMDASPVVLRLRIKGLNDARVTNNVPAMREAAGKERDAIFRGMSALATAKGAAFAVRVESIANGVKAVTAAGAEIIGQVIKTTVLPVPADLLTAGVSKAVSAVLRTPANELVDVVADGDNAATLEAAAK